MSDEKNISIAEMQQEAFETAESKGWHEADEPVKYAFPTGIALIHSEASEALEDFRAGHGITETYYEAPQQEGDIPKPCGIPIELADVVIRVGDMCGKYGVDLQEAIRIKLAYNKTRPQKHGGKLI